MTTALLTHPACLKHVTPPGHPEQVARLERVLAALEPMDLVRTAAPLAAEDDLLRIHPQSHLDSLRATFACGGVRRVGWGHFFVTGIFGCCVPWSRGGGQSG